jgi:hypothetical protein
VNDVNDDGCRVDVGDAGGDAIGGEMLDEDNGRMSSFNCTCEKSHVGCSNQRLHRIPRGIPKEIAGL